MMNKKETNPKDAVGVKKAPLSVVPMNVVHELGIAMLEGARKYGRHNYREAGVRASVYFDATHRHVNAWWEGEDLDPDSGLSHITKAIATLTVLRDCMMQHKWEDDRPPKVVNALWLSNLNARAADVIVKYADAVDPITEVGQYQAHRSPAPLPALEPVCYTREGLPVWPSRDLWPEAGEITWIITPEDEKKLREQDG
jgi:hypothetical protein